MSSGLLAGAARVKLDPPIGIAMAGYGRRSGRATGVHDELAAQAVVLSAGKTRAAIVSVDVLALGIRICDGIAMQIAAETKIPADAIMICSTHTHSGPHFNFFATPRNDANPTDRSSSRDLEWERSLPDRIVKAVVQAHASLQPADMAAIGTRFGLGTNRRLMRADGSIQLAPNYMGVADTELKVLGLYESNLDSNPVAFLTNYPCHGVVLCEDNLLYSRDWPGYLVDGIEGAMNQDHPERPAVALFTQGASGNIDPARRGTFEAAEMAGGAAALGAIEILGREPLVRPRRMLVRRVPLRMKLRDLSAHLAVARGNFQQTEVAMRNHGSAGGYHAKRLSDQHQLSIDELRTLQALDDTNRKDRRVDPASGELATHLTIVAIDDIALVGVPGELFVELGMAIKSNSYFRHTFVLGYCNDLAGYIPTREAYESGGYEVETSRVAQGSGELLVQETLAHLYDIRQALNEQERQAEQSRPRRNPK